MDFFKVCIHCKTILACYKDSNYTTCFDCINPCNKKELKIKKDELKEYSSGVCNKFIKILEKRHDIKIEL